MATSAPTTSPSDGANVAPSSQGQPSGGQNLLRGRGRAWGHSETVCAFRAGVNASSDKQQNTTAKLVALTNQYYVQFALESARNGTWRGSVDADTSIHERGAQDPKQDAIWKRFKTTLRNTTNEVTPLFNSICPNNELPSGRDKAWAERQLALHVYQKTKEPTMKLEELEKCVPEGWSTPVLDVWNIYGPLGENVPWLKSAYNDKEDMHAMPGRRAQRQASHARAQNGAF